MATKKDDGLGFMIPAADDRIPSTLAGAGSGHAHAYSTMQRDALQAGISLSVLCEIFGKDKRDAKERLRNCQPSGMRAGFPIYDLSEAARYLVDPVIDVEEFIKTLRPQDLPVALQSEYWKGQNQRLKYEEDVGDLWRTAQVQTVFADCFRVIRQTVSLFSETVERQIGLTEDQRKLIVQMTDSLLADAGDAVAKHFKDYKGDSDHEARPTANEVDDGLS